MKIYILPVSEALQPNNAKKVFPIHNGEDYSTEQDFLKYLQSNPQLLTTNPQEADFHYLPVFWTRWVINHEWGQKDGDLLQSYVDQSILNDTKTFTICHLSTGAPAGMGKTIIFWASRRNSEFFIDIRFIDIPLICNPLPLPAQLPKKKYLASFMGNIVNHGIRREMADCYNDASDIYIGRPNDVKLYIEKILEAYITLCPRGVGGSSFRFFETMQLGGVPCLIGDLDTRPFKKYFHWENYSLYAETPQKAETLMRSYSKEQLLAMGHECAKVWKAELAFGKWCKYVLLELRDLKMNQ